MTSSTASSGSQQRDEQQQGQIQARKIEVSRYVLIRAAGRGRELLAVGRGRPKDQLSLSVSRSRFDTAIAASHIPCSRVIRLQAFRLASLSAGVIDSARGRVPEDYANKLRQHKVSGYINFIHSAIRQKYIQYIVFCDAGTYFRYYEIFVAKSELLA